MSYIVCRESEKLKVKSAKPKCKMQNCGDDIVAFRAKVSPKPVDRISQSERDFTDKTVDCLYETYYSAKESYVARDFPRLIAFFLNNTTRPRINIPHNPPITA